MDLPSSAPMVDAWARAAEMLQIEEKELLSVASRFCHLNVASLDRAEPTALGLLPESVARKFRVFPLRPRGSKLVVATADPIDTTAERAIGFASGRTLLMELAPPSAIEEAIDMAYSPDRAVQTFLNEFGSDTAEELVEIVEAEEPTPIAATDVAAGPIVKLTNMILHTAVARGASDVHVQPTPGGGVVRYRVDGVLQTGLRLPVNVIPGVTARLKILGRLDIADRHRPQDGRARAMIQDRAYDLRIATVPARGSEKVVIRVLDPHQTVSLIESGLPKREVERIGRLLRNREGILLITGPTGSGKTTTLYAAIREFSSEDLNIMTIEDPVEYELATCTQVQVNPKRGVTFASGLRALLRQDPDVILVGEIRDEETAEVALQASQTGHFVLSTLHTNDAVSAIRRLTDLGLELAAVADSVCGAVAQRLARRLCEECRTEVGDDDLTDREARLEALYGVKPVRRAIGCEACGHSGYRGRIPVMESFLLSHALIGMLRAKVPHHELVAQARKEGMWTLLESALELVRNGVTTIEEVERIVGDPGDAAAAGSSAGGGEPEAGQEAASATAAHAESRTGNGHSRPGGFRPDVWTFGEQAGLQLPLDGESPRVLVVEDDADDRLLVGTLLEGMGFSVVEAADGVEALRLLAQEDLYDLMILDLEMPRLDGLDLLAEVRSSPATAMLPTIILTGWTDQDTEVRLLHHGADDFLRKPIDAPLFRARVRATLRRAMG